MVAQTDTESTDTSAATQDAPQQIDVDPGMALERLDSWVDGAVRLIPNMVIAIVVIVIFFLVAGLVKKLINSQLTSKGRDNLGDVLGGFLRWIIIFVGFLLAATIVIPTLRPGDLIAGLGVSSVAIGFAFKDILQNWLAGLLILLRQPFEIDDQIEVNGHEGTVERIETRATIIKTYDSQRIVIPNSDIYTNAVLVKTAHEFRRSQYDIGIGYADDIDEAREAIKKAVASIDQVETDPAPEALAWDLAASWVTLRARWWTDSRRADVVQIRSEVIIAIKHALDDAGIDMPYETTVQLFHDQTEAEDGDRGAQREGWPAADEQGTKPRWQAEQEQRRADKPDEEESADSAPRH